jgi:hypothetical protein
MVNVFVSHRTADTIKAEQLATDIRSYGHIVWLDKWAIDLGDSIVQRMNEGLTSSTVVLLCFSSEGVLSPWMSREWFSALARQLNGEGVKLLPVRLSGGEPPAILADIKYADAVTDYDAALKSIIRTLEHTS